MSRVVVRKMDFLGEQFGGYLLFYTVSLRTPPNILLVNSQRAQLNFRDLRKVRIKYQVIVLDLMRNSARGHCRNTLTKKDENGVSLRRTKTSTYCIMAIRGQSLSGDHLRGKIDLQRSFRKPENEVLGGRSAPLIAYHLHTLPTLLNLKSVLSFILYFMSVLHTVSARVPGKCGW